MPEDVRTLRLGNVGSRDAGREVSGRRRYEGTSTRVPGFGSCVAIGTVREVTDWDEGARPYLEILMNANGAWAGKLGTGLDMTEAEIEQTLQRQGPSWQS